MDNLKSILIVFITLVCLLGGVYLLAVRNTNQKWEIKLLKDKAKSFNDAYEQDLKIKELQTKNDLLISKKYQNKKYGNCPLLFKDANKILGY